jgi:hypothetical protein
VSIQVCTAEMNTYLIILGNRYFETPYRRDYRRRNHRIRAVEC